MFPKYLLVILFLSLSMGRKNSLQDTVTRKSNNEIGPQDMHLVESTTCEKFAKFARFNPHSVLGESWFVFYYWAPKIPQQFYEFRIPSKQDMKYLHSRFDGHVPASFNWSTTLVFMRNVINNRTSLLVEKGDRGQYWKYSIFKDLPKGQMVDHIDLRIKQTGNNKYLGIMECKRKIAYIMSRVNEVPSQKKLQDEAATLGFRSRGGKSYLYRGHEWMPIPEMDEDDYWMRNNKFKRRFNLD